MRGQIFSFRVHLTPLSRSREPGSAGSGKVFVKVGPTLESERNMEAGNVRNRVTHGCAAFVLLLLLAAGPLGFAQDNPGQATKPTQSQPVEPKGTPTQRPAQSPKTAPQVKEVLPSYEGQNVTSMELAGQPGLDTQQFLPLLAQQPNQPFSQAKVDQSIAVLKTTGKFHDVQLEVRPEPNGVRVLFVLQPASYFGIYLFPGATGQFAYSRLLQVSSYPPKGAYSAVDVQKAQDALETFFRGSGYFEAQVQPEVRTNPPWGLVNVVFHTKLNRRAKFGEVVLRGTTDQETSHLRGVLHSFMARLRRSAIRPGRTYKMGTVQRATQYLANALGKQGYLGAQVKLVGADYSSASNRANVIYQVKTGPVIHVKVTGAHLWSWDRRKLLPVYQQAGVDPELIQEGRQNLVSYFQSKGYFDAKVDSQVKQQDSAEIIVYQITKGPRHKVKDVSVAGNQHFSEKQLVAQIKVEKAHFYSHGKYSDKLVRSSVRNIEDLYKGDGFSSVKVTPQVSNQKGNISVAFHIEEGPQDIVEALDVQGNQAVSVSQLAPKGLKVAPGQPYSSENVQRDRNQIMATYLSNGHLTATFRATAKQIPGQPHRLQVTYQIYEGPQVHTATVVTLGRDETRQKLINRETAEIRTGKPLKEDDLLASETSLYKVGVFDWAEVDPRRDITTQHQEDVIIKVHEAKPNTLTYGFGFDVINRGGSVPSGTVAVPGIPPAAVPQNFRTSEKTFWGPRGTLEYTRNNLFGKAESLTFSALGARLQQNGSILYTDPTFRWTNWASTFSLTGQHNSENPIFTFRQGQFGYQLQRPLNRDKTTNLFLRYTFTETGLTNLLIPELVPAKDQHVRLSTISATYIRDTRDSPTDAHKGIYESYEFDLNPGALGSNFSFAHLLMQTAYYKKIPANIIWANSLRIGLEEAFGGSSVPISAAFFSGGGSTLRGFPLNGAGPQHTIVACGIPGVLSTCAPITVPVGGPELVIINSEFRIPSPVSLPIVKKNLGFAVFYDGGNVFPYIGFRDFGKNYTNSVGGGLRYNTPVGPVRIDIGHNLNAVPGIKSTQIFVTLGQAF
jgi:outer membrane protein insertion porin family